PDDRHDEPVGNVLSGIRQFGDTGKAPGKEIITYLLGHIKPVQMPVFSPLCPPRPRSGRARAVVVLPFLLAILLHSPLPAQNEKEWMLGPFERGEGARPIIQKDSLSTFLDPVSGRMVSWESMATFNPAAILRNDSIFVLYRAEEKLGEREIGGHRSRLGMAASSDGIVYHKGAVPVFYPDEDAQKPNEWPGGTEDPRIVQTQEGLYVMTYTQWNRKLPKLAVATSRDLVHWEKHGPAFQKYKEGLYHRSETKSGAIVTRLQEGRLVAAKINGRYWMYYGVPHIWLASSTNLVDWVPLETHE